jgi:exodeoxyribonuclease V
MEPTKGQAQALDLVNRMVTQEGDHILKINGYAGTGKSTLLSMIRDQVGETIMLAPTGKAALRIKEVVPGGGASTIHQWMYQTTTDPDTNEPLFRLKALDEIRHHGNRLIIIDEASMVGRDLWKDVMLIVRHADLKVIIMGDEFQLPPVSPGDERPFNLLDLECPGVHLTEVTRQAKENPIIRASMDLRENRVTRALMDHGLPAVRDLDLEAVNCWQNGGVVLVHRNATRHKVNHNIRQALKKPIDEIDQGEPLLILRNDYGIDMFNGEVVKLSKWLKKPTHAHQVFDRATKRQHLVQFGKVELESPFQPSPQPAVICLQETFGKLDGQPPCLPKASGEIYGKETRFIHTNLGYCLTAHKAQGSEWDEVIVVIEPSIDLNSLMGRRWVYTALTRSKKNVRLHCDI